MESISAGLSLRGCAPRRILSRGSNPVSFNVAGPMAPGRWRQRLSAELMSDMGDLQAASWSPGGHSTPTATPVSTPVVASRATWGRHSPSTFKSYVTADNTGGRSSPSPATSPASLSAVPVPVSVSAAALPAPAAATPPDVAPRSRFASKSPSRLVP